MKKVRQIMALFGVILLLGLYIATLILAFLDKSKSLQSLKAAIVLTVILPVLIWAYTFIYKLLKK